MSTTQYLSDLRKALPRPFQHLVRDARRYHNDRKARSTYRPEWVEGAEELTAEQVAARHDLDADRARHDMRRELGYITAAGSRALFTHPDLEGEYTAEQVAERENFDASRSAYLQRKDMGWAYSRSLPQKYVQLPEAWHATTKAELYQIRAEQRAERATPGSKYWMDLRFMELMAGSAQQWFEGIRDCTILGDGARHAGTIEREVKEALGQGCLFKAAGVNPAPTAAEAEAERTEAAPEAPVELTTLVVPPVPASPRPSIITHADESWTAAPPADPLHQAA